jgi:hypothetical protein
MNHLNKTICPVYDGVMSDLLIQGEFTDQVQSFLSIRASIKDEVLNNKTKYLEFKKYLNENPLMLQLFMVDSKVDYEEYSEFLGNYLMVINSYASINQVKNYEISISQLTFKTDNNILWQMPDESTTVMFSKSDYNSYIVEDREKIDIYDKNTLNIFYIKSTSKAFYYERTYQKLTDFLANMTGILSQIILIIFVIMNYLNEKAARQKVMRKIMKFKGGGNFHVDKILSLFKNPEDHFIMRNQNETFKNYEKNNNFNNTSKKLFKNENQISKNEIKIELEEIPASEGTPVGFSSSHREKNPIFEVRKINYEYASNNVKDNKLNNIENDNRNQKDYLMRKNDEKVEITPNNIFQNFATPEKKPNHVRDVSTNSRFYYNKSSTRREFLPKDENNLNIYQNDLNEHASFSNQNNNNHIRNLSSNRNSRVEISPESYWPKYGNENKNVSSSQTSQPKVTPSTQSNNLKNSNEGVNSKIRQFKPLKLSSLQIIKNAICCIKRNKTDILFGVAERKVMYYMDVLTYIRMLGEIDLLKEVIFNDQQKFLFEFLAKPLLDDKNAKLDENYYTKKSERAFVIDFKEIEGLYKSYNKVKTDNLRNSENSQRLIDMINEEVDLLRSQNL